MLPLVQPASPPKASETSPVFHEVIDPVVRPLGFATRKSGSPTWKKKVLPGSTETLFFRIQRHPDAVDPYAGGRFRIEFEHSLSDRPYVGLAGRAEFDQLLNPDELETVVRHQKQVIKSLRQPPKDWIAGYPEFLRDTYLRNFDPDETFRTGNFWHRFLSVEHVAGWARLIAALLPVVLERALRLSPGMIYLGTMIDLTTNPLQPSSPIVLKPSSGSSGEPPPDPAWRPASRRKGADLVCGICGKPIGSSDITAEKVGYSGIFHFECRLREMGSP